MQYLIDFIDRYALDPQIYIVAPHRDSQQRFELYWEREKGPTRWRVRLIGQTDWSCVTGAMLPALLEQLGVDTQRVELQLRSIAMTQVVFATTLTAEARRLFGHGCVEQAVEDHQAFLDEIQAVVGRFARSKLKGLAGGGQGSKRDSNAKPGHLSLVAEK